MPPRKPRLAALVRISHMGGRRVGDANVHADQEQVETVERYAAQHRARLHWLPPELDVSGGLPLERRPSLIQAVEGVERGDFDGIIVAYLSRLGRNVSEQLRAFDRVEAVGGKIICVQENIDTSSPWGRHMRTVLLSQAAAEREQHADRFEERRREATRAGIWQRRQMPRGYRRDTATRKLVPNRRAEEVRAAFRERANGTSISELARRLQMTASGVRQLLGNRVYLGELHVGRHVNLEAHEPLVTLEEFEAAQRSVSRPPRGRSTGPALLAGLVRCTSCGHVMTRGNSSGRPVYTCPGQHSGERCPRPASVTTSLLDEHVEPIILAELARLRVTATAGRAGERAQAKVAEAELQLAAYLESVDAAGIGAASAARGMRKRQDALDAAKDELRAELARRPALPSAGSGADAWARLDAQERNTVLRALLSAVVVRPVGRGQRVPLRDRVRVLALGANIELPKHRGGEASGIVPVPFPDDDSIGVLGVLAGEDALEHPGSGREVLAA